MERGRRGHRLCQQSVREECDVRLRRIPQASAGMCILGSDSGNVAVCKANGHSKTHAFALEDVSVATAITASLVRVGKVNVEGVKVE